MSELKQTGFFSDQFIDNYNEIALRIDKELKIKKMKWLVGDTPPFGNNANPWCNCQDSPTDKYWEKITFDKLTFDKKNASFIWTWGDGFEYKVKTVYENNKWKIAKLQGFDFNEIILN